MEETGDRTLEMIGQQRGKKRKRKKDHKPKIERRIVDVIDIEDQETQQPQTPSEQRQKTPEVSTVLSRVRRF